MAELIYAVKSVENKEINKTFTSWDECKPIVFGKKAVYNSFASMEEAVEFLQTAPVKTEEYGHGYIPRKEGKHIMYGKFLFDRCPEKENGYSVRIYQTEHKERFSCVGYFLPTNKRLLYAFSGQFIKDPNYGYEFIVESYTEHITDKKDDILKYLSSGIIKGIGPKKAELIYKRFGSRTIEVFEKTPDRLLEVKGISKKILKKINESYSENKMSRECTSYLLNYGISPKYGAALYKQYGTTVLSKIQENPYIICMEKGLTYEDADRIALDVEYSMDTEERFLACANYVLKQNESTGNCGMDVIEFQKEVFRRLESKYITKEQIFNHTCSLIKKHYFHVTKLKDAHGNIHQYIFLHHVYDVELELAKNALRIRDSKRERPDKNNILALIKQAESHFHIQLDNLQKNAILKTLLSNICIITGGPGTGKTTIINVINYIYEKLYPENKRIFLAPTGRAARKITEATGEEAYTANSYLHFFDDTVRNSEDDVVISDALTVVDEFSMADIYLSRSLFDSIGINVTLAIVGDVDQLPSVGPGAVLRDLIQSNTIPVIRLERIYRQDKDTQIYLNSRKIKSGDTELLEGADFHMHTISSMEDIKHEMAKKYCERVNEFGLGNVMMLCPFREHTAGVFDMNTYLQTLLNPKKENEMEIVHNGMIFRKGDIIMQQKKNTEQAANGDVGFIINIYSRFDKDGDIIEDDYEIVTEINKRTVTYTKETIDTLTLAYATTIHKSQGSEADAVVFCLSSFHAGMLYRNIPYVAISRGKKQVDTYGDRAAWEKAIKNEDISKLHRITLTEHFLKYLNGEFVSYIA
mgnify:CR=1 FL=1